MKRTLCIAIVSMILGGCAAVNPTGVLSGLQALTSTAGIACQQGMLPQEYCKYVSLAWLAEQQLAAALELNCSTPTPENAAALGAATKAAEEARKNLEAAQQ